MTTATDYEIQLHAARQMLTASKRKVAEHRQKIKELVAAQRDYKKTVRLDKAAAREAARATRLAARERKKAEIVERKTARDQKRAERIAKMEARLAKLKLAAGRKHSKPVVYTAEQIAALNAA